MLYYKMSLALLQSFVKEIQTNDAKMAQNKKDIDDIKCQLIFMNEYKKDIDDIKCQLIFMNKALKDFDELQDAADAEAAVIIDGIQAEILALKAIDVKEEKEEEEIREDIKDIQQKIAALKAKIELHKTINSEYNENINQVVDNLQENVKVLQDNDKKEEADKAIALAAEIATLEAQLKELTMALNVFNPHPELFLGASNVAAQADANGFAKEFSGMVT